MEEKTDKKQEFAKKMDYLKAINQAYQLIGERTTLTAEQALDQKTIGLLVWLYAKEEGERIADKTGNTETP